MSSQTSGLDRQLRQALCDHPRRHGYRYTDSASDSLLEGLFRSLTNDRPDYLHELFPNGFPSSYKLQDAQGVQENAEYTAAAKGHPCGHIFNQERLAIIAVLVPMTARQYSVPDVLCPVIMKDINTQ